MDNDKTVHGWRARLTRAAQRLRDIEKKNSFYLVLSLVSIFADIYIWIDDYFKHKDVNHPLVQLIITIREWIESITASQAHAADISTMQQQAEWVSRANLYIVLVFGVFLILMFCIIFIFFSDRPQRERDNAWDAIKLICGFVLGTLTNKI